MIKVVEIEKIRRAYYIDSKSMRQIAEEMGHSRETVKKAIESAEFVKYRLKEPRPSPVLGAYKARIDKLLAESEGMRRKQRYTSHTIYKIIKGEGYIGAESTVRNYIARRRKEKKRPAVYLPLEFDPGADAQVDWGEAEAILKGDQITVQIFVARLCFSRKLFVMAFPNQKQEAFLEGHVRAFHHFGGVPRRISYDNLKAAVKRVLKGRNRQEQDTFIIFRSHYLFESHFCNLGKGNEKGRVEDGVGFSRRNFMVPYPKADSYQELNRNLLAACLEDDKRRVDRQPTTIGEAWQIERAHLLSLPPRDVECCVSRTVTLNGFCQVVFETNRYSVPYNDRYHKLVLKAYPFHIKIIHENDVIASHPRCYEREQDILDPIHYLPLLEQRPGAFEHAKPIRRWREGWPPVYERLLTYLKADRSDGRGVREFIRILKLHQDHPDDLVAQAIEKALEYGCPHFDGVELCLRQLAHPDLWKPPIVLDNWPKLQQVDQHTPDLNHYNRLLNGIDRRN